MLSPLARFFAINHQLVLFVYGEVFFILGFAIVLYTRRTSRSELARSLRWLAAFGFTHGFHEWGDLFIPIQIAYLSPDGVQVLYGLQLILLAMSFAFLLMFGIAILFPPRQRSRFQWIPYLLLGLWMLASIGLFFFLPTEVMWRDISNTLARYFIGFPGAMLAAYGLRVHTIERILPLNMPHIVRHLRMMGIALGLYAIMAGIVAPPVPFFPGNILNTRSFTEVVGIPPWVFRSFLAVVMTYEVIRAMEIFDVETNRRIEELEHQRILSAERERLARELHDGAIQKVYTAGLLVESAARLAEQGGELEKRLRRAITAINDSIADLRRNLAQLHEPSMQDTTPLPVLLKRLAEDPHYTAFVNISLNVDLSDDRNISPWRSAHIMAIVNEALSNTIRHARAHHLWISVRGEEDSLRLVIRDDGIGFPPDVKLGYGLRNMRDRARLLGGTIEFNTNKGAEIVLTIPWRERP